MLTKALNVANILFASLFHARLSLRLDEIRGIDQHVWPDVSESRRDFNQLTGNSCVHRLSGWRHVSLARITSVDPTCSSLAKPLFDSVWLDGGSGTGKVCLRCVFGGSLCGVTWPTGTCQRGVRDLNEMFAPVWGTRERLHINERWMWIRRNNDV